MADRLSDLPDDLLCCILHFAPLKEAASTTALSRRWRVTPLWLSSAAVNLETRLQFYHSETGDVGSLLLLHRGEALEVVGRDAFVTEATAALDAADVPVTRLTLRIESNHHKAVDDFLNRDMEEDGVVLSRDRNLVDFLLSHRAVCRVEEFRLVFTVRDVYMIGYTVALDALPLETLRVLELSNCRGLYHSQAATLVLPRLSSLLLCDCSQHLGSLQRAIDAAPVLATIHLDCVYIYATLPHPRWPKTGRLRCPVATVLVLDRCTWKEKNSSGAYQTVNGVEIDAPRLRRFRYIGRILSLKFIPQALELEQVDPHDERYAEAPDLDLTTFWRLARSFTSTKEMKLWVKHLEEVAVLTEASRVELLPMFGRLRRLELRGVYWTKGDTAAVTNFLLDCFLLGLLSSPMQKPTF